METIQDFFGDVGAATGRYARRIGRSRSAHARRVRWQRGGIALGVLAVAGVGIPLLLRYLRARKVEAEANVVDEGDIEAVVIMEVTPIPESAPIGPGLA